MPEEQFDTRGTQSSAAGMTGRSGQPSGNRSRQSGQRQPRRQNVEREFSENGSPHRGQSRHHRKSGRRHSEPRVQSGFRDVQDRTSGAAEDGSESRTASRTESRRDRRPGGRHESAENSRRAGSRPTAGRNRDRRGPSGSPDTETAAAAPVFDGVAAVPATAGGSDRADCVDRTDGSERTPGRPDGRDRQRLRAESADRQRRARARKRMQPAIVEETYEDLQHENDRLMKEIILEIADIRTITLD